jgi:3-O-methylgallate 3,4-dioxygenase
MAKIVLGIGTSHGPMLSTPPEDWALRVVSDRQAQHPFKARLPWVSPIGGRDVSKR